MSDEDHLEKIVETIKMFSSDPDRIGADTKILDEGLVDSLNVIQIVSQIENVFSVKISPMDISISDFETPKSTLEALKRIGKL